MSDPKRAIQAVTGKVSPKQSKPALPNIPAVPSTQDAGLANFLASVKL